MTTQVGFRAGDVIITEGEAVSEAYVLDRGSVEVYLKGPPEQRLRILRRGDIFGEMALITEQPRSASVRALEDVDVRVIKREEFLTTWRRDPDLVLPLLSTFCERIRTLTALVAELTRRSPKSRETAQVYLGDSDIPKAPRLLSAERKDAIV